MVEYLHFGQLDLSLLITDTYHFILQVFFVCTLYLCSFLTHFVSSSFLHFYSMQANAFRNSHRIYVSGPDIPDAVESFKQLFSSYTLPSYMARNVTSVGYLEPTPIQMQALPLLLQVMFHGDN